MTEELVKTLKLIIDRYGERLSGSVFIPMSDFPWYNERNGQLTKLHDEGKKLFSLYLSYLPTHSVNRCEYSAYMFFLGLLLGALINTVEYS